MAQDGENSSGDSDTANGRRKAPQADYLGYGVYADTLWARMARALAKDADGRTPLGDDPLVVGIFGEWGAGKSKLLSLVQDRARAQSRRDIAERILTATSGNPLTVTVPVFFQPWKYEHERHLHVPLAVHIAQALKEAWKELPADIEQLRGLVASADKTLAEAGQTWDAASSRFDSFKRLWDGARDAVQSRAGAVVAGTADIMLTSVGVPPFASLAREKIVGAMGGRAARGQGGDDEAGGDGGGEGPDAEDAEAHPGGQLAKGDRPTSAHARQPTPKPATADPWAWKDDGLGFYRMHRQLQALTRPKLDAKLLKAAGLAPTPGIEFDLRINFVVFIDDLDRCLPEKAVEALELIKTVFNLESFAFVLALDEEVVERGIGHRYRDYHFQGKKPEMPITGFEYLEKIVHLPFRLPALTRRQAVAFVHEYERQMQPEAGLRWFTADAGRAEDARAGDPVDPADASNRSARQAAGTKAPGKPAGEGARGRTEPRASPTNLLALALDSFDAWVPRKLIRMVELFHQTAEVARQRGRPLRWEPPATHDPQAVDLRVVLALVLIQLFQPELYRLMRRRVQAFPFLLAAFATRPNGQRDLKGGQIADVDLWEWVAPTPARPAGRAGEQDQDKDERQDERMARRAGRARLAQALDDAVERISRIGELAAAETTDLTEAAQAVNAAQAAEARARAQHVRLPLVAQLVEHRATHRHMFDVLKLMRALALSMEASGRRPDPAELTFEPYRTLLGQELPDPQQQAPLPDEVSGATSKVRDPRPRHRVRDVGQLFADLVSPQTEVQANLVSHNELPAGSVLDAESAAELLRRVQEWAKTHAHTPGAAETLVNGLRHLAPAIAREDGPAFWELVRERAQGQDQEGAPLADLAALQRREAWMDLRSTLGADQRFDPSFFYLPKFAPGQSAKAKADEPIPGFVRVPKGSFQIGEKGEGKNLPRIQVIKNDFFIARMPTTVDQYQVFITAGGYEDEHWWDTQGLAWLRGHWGSKVGKEDLIRQGEQGERTADQRRLPLNWAVQQAHSSRPVKGINWFEARAYVRWLGEQLRSTLPVTDFQGYEVCLPVGVQWNRAAQAAGETASDGRRWPQPTMSVPTDDAAELLLWTKDYRRIGQASVVGLFEPNPLRVSDLPGYLAEWQDNLLGDRGRYVSEKRIPRITGLVSPGLEAPDWLLTHEDWGDAACPEVCGGSFMQSQTDHTWANHWRRRPDDEWGNIGFRVAISRVNFEP